MSQHLEQLWQKLHLAGLVEGELPQQTEPESPWYVTFLLGFSGWLAAFFLLGFFGMAAEVILNSSLASFIVGSAMIVGAYVVLSRQDGVFLKHLALAISLTGQLLVAASIFYQNPDPGALSFFSLALIQLILALLMPNYIHRVMSALFGAAAFGFTLWALDEPYLLGPVLLLATSVLFLHEFSSLKYFQATPAESVAEDALSLIVNSPSEPSRWLLKFDGQNSTSIMQALGFGFVSVLVAFKSFTLFDSLARRNADVWVTPWMAELLTGLVALYVVWQVLQRYNLLNTGRVRSLVLLGTVVIIAASLQAPGIIIGIVIMLLGFHGSNRVLLGIGITALLFYISSYYYLLDHTLLEKSGTLLIVGVALLATRWLTNRLLPEHEGADNA